MDGWVLRVSGVPSMCLTGKLLQNGAGPNAVLRFPGFERWATLLPGESKSLLGRGEKAESETIGRHFGVTWFE